ncbi:MAG TPA: hypothetical protein ENN19_15595 [Chloroflexi bacterium]|nr:hypothetical protein [Chloroflexota bacterium]
MKKRWVLTLVLTLTLLATAGTAHSTPLPSAPSGLVALYTANASPTTPALQDLSLLDSVTHDGVTWTFSQPAPVGQFVNGDYYVVGPVTITHIDPLPTPENGRHGSVLNMPCNNSSRSPFDSRVQANRYAPELRIYPPFAMQPGDTLISSISVNTLGAHPNWLRESDRSQTPVRSVSVLTVLDAPVAPDAFRPSYCDRAQTIYYSRDLQRNLLPALPRVSSMPDIAEFAEHFRRPWLDVCFFGFDAAIEYQAAYGREVGRAAGMASLLLMLDYTPAEKEPLLIHFVQYGIDLWGIAGAGHPGWPAHGGHGSGRKWPLIFGGTLLGDSDMQSPSHSYPDLRFGEDMQTMYDTGWTGANVVYAGHQGVWNGAPVSANLAWGSYEHLHPSQWESQLGGGWYYIGEDYRRCCTSLSWIGQALSAHILGVKSAWDHDALFDYADRWMTEDDTEHVAAILAATGQDYSAGWARQQQCWDDFVEEMWAAYRDYQPTPTVELSAAPGDATARLIWRVSGSLPTTTTWSIEYYGQTVAPPVSISGIVSPTRAYTLTGLTNYTWYTVTLSAMLETTPILSDTVRVMPTDRFVYLPLVLR